MKPRSFVPSSLDDDRFPTSIWDDKENMTSFQSMKLLDDSLLEEMESFSFTSTKSDFKEMSRQCDIPIKSSRTNSCGSTSNFSRPLRAKSVNRKKNVTKSPVSSRRITGRTFASVEKRHRPRFQTPSFKTPSHKTPSRISRPKTPTSATSTQPHRFHKCIIDENSFLNNIKCNHCHARELALLSSPDIAMDIKSLLSSPIDSPQVRQDFGDLDGSALDILVPSEIAKQSSIACERKSPTLNDSNLNDSQLSADTESECTDDDEIVISRGLFNQDTGDEKLEKPLQDITKTQVENVEVIHATSASQELESNEQLVNVGCETVTVNRLESLRVELESSLSRKSLSTIATQTSQRKKSILKRASKSLKRMLTPRRAKSNLKML